MYYTIHVGLRIAVEKKIGVVLQCQNRLARESIARILQKRSDIEVLHVQPETFISEKEIAESIPDVVVLDSLQLLPEQEISAANRSVAERHIKRILIAMPDDPKHFLKAIRRGAVGYVLYDASASDVIAAIRAVGQGEAICPPHYIRLLFEYIAVVATRYPNRRAKSSIGLTSREQQLIPLIARGLTNKQIAASLTLSEQTVKNHVHRILGKLGVDDRLDVSEACEAQLLGM
ncbi:MAG TPA: response regulator transcription factor [Candidatus Sulfotelmatobacter sp.]|nr:response regulator transcription factor [Candidatus Sulfotelmatobacter sp.]